MGLLRHSKSLFANKCSPRSLRTKPSTTARHERAFRKFSEKVITFNDMSPLRSQQVFPPTASTKDFQCKYVNMYVRSASWRVHLAMRLSHVAAKKRNLFAYSIVNVDVKAIKCNADSHPGGKVSRQPKADTMMKLLTCDWR